MINKRLWDVTKQLIAFDTVSHNSNLACIDYLANLLSPLGFELFYHHHTVNDIAKANLIAHRGPKTSNGIIISGHTDVVPFADQPGWNSDALELIQAEEHLIGRGVADMKTFIAQVLVALEELPQNKHTQPLMLIFTCDEEVCCQGSGRLMDVLNATIGDLPLPPVAWIGEPTNFNCYHAHKGYAGFSITVHSKGGHSSRPDLGTNAIEVMSTIIAAIRDTNEVLTQQTHKDNIILYPDYPHSNMNLGTIHGGTANNMIAEKCQLDISLRMTTDIQVDDVLNTLKNQIEQRIQHENTHPQPLIEWSPCVASPALCSDSEAELPKLLIELTGQPGGLGAPFATDGGQFTRANIASYICGPGLIEQAHQPNESLSLQHFNQGLTLAKQIITTSCYQ